MIQLEVTVSGKPKINLEAVNYEAALLADKVAATLTNEVKLALVSFGAVATGKTLRGTTWRAVADRNQALFGVASHGTFHRQVISPRGFRFIVSGRRAGAKMPVRLVGTGPRGGKIFEPFAALIEWFNALNIPRSAWFPILRAISRRGIPPKNVPMRAIRNAMPNIRGHAIIAAGRIANGLIKYA